MHFALVHGAYHGAWCWDLVRKELASRGVPGIEPVETAGGHSQFLSRPRELAGLLARMASG